MEDGSLLNLRVSTLLSFLSCLDPVCTLQMNTSVGLNIFSAISSAVGVMLFITDMCLTGTLANSSDYHYYDNWVSVLRQSSLPPLSYVQTIPERAWQLSLPSDPC